ncbi:MAG: o-succinylbenzoate synthase, partial [Thermoplasmata archaeon]
MKNIIIYNVKLPLKVPFETSFGIQYYRDALLFRYIDDVEAWSESVTDSDPGYSYEYNGSAINIFENYLLKFLQ